jgi:flagellar biosynthesis anti-sigma factor FlgM
MDIRNSLDGLKSLLGVPTTTPAPPQSKSSSGASGGGLGSDLATFSSAGNEVSLTASDTEVRMDKVTAIQSALASGTYNVSPSAVASKLVGSMLGSE